MNIAELIQHLQNVAAEHGDDIPVLLTIQTGEDAEGDILFLADCNMKVTAEQDHDSEGMFVRIAADDQE